MILHHPEDATLASYAAGSLPASLALVVGCHLEYCPRCRSRVAEAEALGGALIEALPRQQPSAAVQAAMLARLDDDDVEPLQESAPEPEPDHDAASAKLPAKLRRILGNGDLRQQPWRAAGPGVRMLRLGGDDGKAILLDIAPDQAMPVHTHTGTELTLIINGDYKDSLGHFGPGDVADLDSQTEHQPKAGSKGCLCLAGLDAPLRYEGLIPRLLQPFFRL